MAQYSFISFCAVLNLNIHTNYTLMHSTYTPCHSDMITRFKIDLQTCTKGPSIYYVKQGEGAGRWLAESVTSLCMGCFNLLSQAWQGGGSNFRHFLRDVIYGWPHRHTYTHTQIRTIHAYNKNNITFFCLFIAIISNPITLKTIPETPILRIPLSRTSIFSV